jgi:hypothetical protein
MIARMLARTPRFRAGQRVRPSAHGIAANLFPKTRHQQSGVVVKVDRFGSPTVRWDRFKTPREYYAGFIAPDRRRRTHTGQAGQDRE